MALITYTCSAAAVSWIDPATGLPEVDRVVPASSVDRSFLTGSSGFRFANFMDVWARYDTSRNTIVGHGFASASGIYRSLSYGGIPSRPFETIRRVAVGSEPITFTQIVGARTESPERIGGLIGGPLGNILGSAVSAFPPIWSELRIRIFNDGRTEASVVRHSLFPSLTFYTRPGDTGRYVQTPVSGSRYYNAVPNLDRWNEAGWGAQQSSAGGATAGNPWNYEESIFSGIDPTQPFGW